MTLDYSEFERFADEMVNRFPVYALESAETAMPDAMIYLMSEMPEYPPEIKDRLLPPDGVSWLRTEKQRRWFFAAVKSGDLKGWKWIDGHPEKVGGARTGNLGRAQNWEVSKVEDGVEGTLGFDPALAPYAPWVVGEDYPGSVIGGQEMYQSRIHVDRWWQFGVIIEQNVDEAWNAFNTTFWEQFSSRINQGV